MEQQPTKLPKKNIKLVKPDQIYPVVMILWEDISMPAQGWDSKIDPVKPMMVTSVGYLISETDKHYVLAMDLADDGEHNQRAQIPKSVADKIWILRKAQKNNGPNSQTTEGTSNGGGGGSLPVVDQTL